LIPISPSAHVEETDDLHKKRLAHMPTARSPTSRASLFLSSSASDFFTGTAIPVDGGFSVMG
jgi:2-deoxy-D-gluconate 3-dehydrogenase